MTKAMGALILSLIFTGSIFCKVWIYTQSQADYKSSTEVTYFKKMSDPRKSDAPTRCAWNRLFKSRRRIEKYGFVQKALSYPIEAVFYETAKILPRSFEITPAIAEVFQIPQPPRLFSIV